MTMSAPLLERLTIVLVEPRNPLNIGAALRACRNMGVSDLRLVSPYRMDPDRIAVTAPGLEREASRLPIFDTTAEAVRDAGLRVGFTARQRRGHQRMWDLETFAAALPARIGPGESRACLLFGREDFGLSNDDLALCNGYVTISTAPDHSSLNLAQAVLLACYAVRCAAPEATIARGPDPEHPPATGAQLDGLIAAVREALEAIAFFKFPGAEDNVLRSLRRILGRAQVDEREVRLLRGIVSEAMEGGQRG